MTKPKSVHWYLSPLLKQGKAIVWDLMKSILPRDSIYKVHESELWIKLKNGARWQLLGADNPDAIRGPGADSVVLEECRFMYPHIWHEIVFHEVNARNGDAMFITSPGGRDWVYKLWLRGVPATGLKHCQDCMGHIGFADPKWASFHFNSFDNPWYNHEELRREMETMPASVRDQEIWAKILESQGLVYPEFQEPVHLIDSFPLPNDWPMFEGADWGLTNPTAWLFARVNPADGNVYVFDEHYESGLNVLQHSPMVLAKRGPSTPVATASDPSMFREEGGYKRTLADDFFQASKGRIQLVPAQARPKTRAMSIVSQYLLGLSGPRVYFFRGKTPNTAMEFGLYSKSMVPDESKNPSETPRNSHDHAMNALEYLLTYIHDYYLGKTFPYGAKKGPMKMTPELRAQLDEQYRKLGSRIPEEYWKGRNRITVDPNTGYLC